MHSRWSYKIEKISHFNYGMGCLMIKKNGIWKEVSAKTMSSPSSFSFDWKTYVHDRTLYLGDKISNTPECLINSQINIMLDDITIIKNKNVAYQYRGCLNNFRKDFKAKLNVCLVQITILFESPGEGKI